MRFFSDFGIRRRDPSAITLPDHSPVPMSHLLGDEHRVFSRRQKRGRIAMARLIRVSERAPRFSEQAFPESADFLVHIKGLERERIAEDATFPTLKKGLLHWMFQSLSRRDQENDVPMTRFCFCFLHMSPQDSPSHRDETFQRKQRRYWSFLCP